MLIFSFRASLTGFCQGSFACQRGLFPLVFPAFFKSPSNLRAPLFFFAAPCFFFFFLPKGELGFPSILSSSPSPRPAFFLLLKEFLIPFCGLTGAHCSPNRPLAAHPVFVVGSFFLVEVFSLRVAGCFFCLLWLTFVAAYFVSCVMFFVGFMSCLLVRTYTQSGPLQP